MSSFPPGNSGDLNPNARYCENRRRECIPAHCVPQPRLSFCSCILPYILGAFAFIILCFILWFLLSELFFFFPPTFFNFACRGGVKAFVCKAKRCVPSCDSAFLGFLGINCKTWDDTKSILKGRDNSCFDDHLCIGGEEPEIYIELSDWIHLDHITITHRNKVKYIPSDVPKDFLVYGCKDNCGDMSILIGKFQYNINGLAKQKFVSKDKKSIVRAVVIKIVSTWGHQASRIHRVGIYGEGAESADLRILTDAECLANS